MTNLVETTQVSHVVVSERVREIAQANPAKWEAIMSIRIDGKTDPTWLVTRLTQLVPAKADQIAKIWQA